MIRHRFEPGLFELGFRSKDNLMILHSWGPASFLLKSGSLSQFGGTIFHIPEKDILINGPDGDIVEWSHEPSLLSLDRLLGLMKIKHVFQRIRIRHIEKKNRIIGVHLFGKKPFDNLFFNDVCKNYES